MLVFYVLALMFASASMSMTLMIWQRYRKAIIRSYGLFLISLTLIWNEAKRSNT